MQPLLSSDHTSDSFPSSESYTDQLEELQTTVISMATENAQLRAACDGLAVHINARQEALQQHIKRLHRAQEELRAENARLQAQIGRRTALVDQIGALDHSFRGFLNRSPNSDSLSDLVQSRSSSRASSSGGTLDPIASQIIAKYPIFGDCRTNRDFVLRVKQFVIQIEGGASTTDSLIEERLRNQLTTLESDYRKRTAGDALAIAGLAGEIDRADQILEEHQRRCHPEADFIPGGMTPRKSRTPERDIPARRSLRPRDSQPQTPRQRLRG
jgi:hypothetical protein